LDFGTGLSDWEFSHKRGLVLQSLIKKKILQRNISKKIISIQQNQTISKEGL